MGSRGHICADDEETSPGKPAGQNALAPLRKAAPAGKEYGGAKRQVRQRQLLEQFSDLGLRVPVSAAVCPDALRPASVVAERVVLSRLIDGDHDGFGISLYRCNTPLEFTP